MKKLIALLFALCLLLAACGDTTKPTSTEPAVTQEALDAMLVKLEETAPVGNGKAVNAEVLKDLMNIDMENVELFSGKLSSLNVLSDQIIIIKAKTGTVDTVVEQLESRREDVAASFELYDMPESEKAAAGLVVKKGDIVILAIVGDVQADVNATYTAMQSAIDALE